MGYRSPAQPLKGDRVKKIIAAIVGVVVLAGAGIGLWIVLETASPVATVGKEKVSATDVNNSIKEILAERKGVATTGMQLAKGNDLTMSEVNFHLISYLLADTASANGISVSAADVAARRANIVTQVGGEAKLPQALVAANIAQKDFPLYLKTLLFDEGLAKQVMKQGVVQANAGQAIQALVTAEAKKVGITVNSKYGKWDPAQAAVVANTAAPASK